MQQQYHNTHKENGRMNRIYKALVWAFILFPVAAMAQDSLTVDEAIATALQNNYDILLSKEDSAVAAINNEYRNAVFLPTLNASSTILSNKNNQLSKFTDREVNRKGLSSNNFNAALNLNWTLFDGFRMFVLRDRLNATIIQGNLTIRNQVVNTVAEVITTYYDIVRQKQQLRNIQEQQTFSSDRLRLAQYKLDIGVGVRPDVLQAQIDFNTQKAAAINQAALIDQRKQDLNRLMNIPLTLDYKVSDSIQVDSGLLLGNLVANLEQTSPALRLARNNIELALLDVREAKTLRYPTIGFISAYNFTRNSNNSVVNPISQPLFNQTHGFNYGLTASVPIFNRFSVRQQIRQAELSVNYRQLAYENQVSLVNTNILNNYRTYIAQREIVDVNDSSVVLSRENLNIERERYRLGATTFIELRQAEENLANAITNAINARYNVKVAETELLRLKGEIVK
jgi:outer membrane protein TolC